MRRFFLPFLLLLCFYFQFKVAVAQPTSAPPTSSEILLHLKKLKVLGSVLYVAAHPDDENNALLPYLAKEKLYRTAYLSLTRGDGGQNLIGDEQGTELGMIRTEELLAARKIDGAEQFFSTAYEFGYSKSYQEALKIWDSTKVLADMVWVIRKYQPDVIINRFPPDKRAGHGHHAASAVLSAIAFKAAADPTQFPEQFKYGVKPWQAKRLLWNTFSGFGSNTTSEDQFKIDIGGFNPLIGKSYGELGAEARTMHKSQGEGRPRRRGENIEYFATIGGEAPKNDLMDGVDVSWKRVDPSGETEKIIDKLIDSFNVSDPSKSIPQLLKLYDRIPDTYVIPKVYDAKDAVWQKRDNGRDQRINSRMRRALHRSNHQ
jgi:LmbE family N-acetylglucosaminyl deacetylase